MSTSPVRAAGPRRPTLLVVDDQMLNIQVLHQVFGADHQVLMATGGAQAVQMCRAHLPDLVLLDVVMPGMGGHEVCRRLKADPLTRDIPVVFVTAQDDPDMETRGLELGAVDFIVKPISPAVVRARVKTHLGFSRTSALLAATLESAAAGILVTDFNGRVSLFNAPFLAMWSLTAETMAACRDETTVFDLLQARVLHPETHRLELDAALARGEAPDRFDAIELPDDRHLERQIRPFRINGRQAGHVISFRDVTEHWRAATQLRALNDTLEARIVHRTSELQAAVQSADTANRAKSAFLSNMSHEIRTPLSGVIGMVHLALKADPNERQRECLEQIQFAGQHLLGIVNDILDFSKIEAGKLQLEETDFVLAELLAALAGQTTPAALDKGLSLVFQCDDGLAERYRGDALRIHQVLLNFVGNAVKFSCRGEVRVRAMAPDGAAPGCGLRFEVSDQGPGLTAADAAGLFQSFHQADASTTRRHGGTGLGLAICRQLATLMGGEVGVHSQPGVGSTFWFSVPVSVATQGVAVEPAAPDLAVIRGARVLVVDDNLLNQRVAMDLLQDLGAQVDLASNGQQAVEWLQRQAFDCVLMDLQMPVLDGLQATRLIKAMPAAAAIPVIAVTANASEHDRLRCLDAGMVDFIGKPFNPAHLYATVARWLGQARPVEPEAPSFDLAVLAHNVAGNPQRMRRYASMFQESIAQTLAELHAALEQGDLCALADLGHRLKASARMVGALGFADRCQALEDLREQGSLQQASTIVQAMPALLEQASARLDEEFA
ncbi:response regulator [Rubrivivax gelatinosus]|uniref:histidine kinase n=1 Tax=Rubrivivax gelatinosus TaxID=28068 RepID=A0ABS1DVV3_RUBGE|nr:response regulator [Rubrivivax gelatinosus]MBK1713509.1 hypothetical protein [Rubrivivax gelatinosus]